MGTMSRILDRALSVLGLLAVAATGAVLSLPAAGEPPTVAEPWGTCTDAMRSVVGSPCWEPDAPTVPDAASVLGEAARVAELTEGLVCWEPSTGRVGSHVVVRDTSTDVLSLQPLTPDLFAAASAGAYVTVSACVLD